MASWGKIVWDKTGQWEKLRRQPEVEARLKKEADKVATKAGEGYEADTGRGKTRSRASVITATADAMRKESKSSNLLRALGGGG